MRIRFQFDPEKALQAMVYLVDRLGCVDKAKLTKLLYIADRDHFLAHGYPITGDSQYAMPFGPVPTSCLRMLNAEDAWAAERLLKHLHADDYTFYVRERVAQADLTADELATLDQTLRTHGAKPTWRLVDETHTFPEYRRTYRENTSTLIPYELMLELYGDESKFRHGRPVISREMAAKMICPLPAADADL
jgi:uncharacterized phage-associated protein